METIQMITLSAVTIGITMAILWGSLFCRAKLKSLKEYLPMEGNVIIDTLFDTANSVITSVAAATVGKLEQIVGKDLRALIGSGQASKDDLYALAGDAYKEILKTVSPEIIQTVQENVADVELYIRNIIETELLKLKAEIYP